MIPPSVADTLLKEEMLDVKVKLFVIMFKQSTIPPVQVAATISTVVDVKSVVIEPVTENSIKPPVFYDVQLVKEEVPPDAILYVKDAAVPV